MSNPLLKQTQERLRTAVRHSFPEVSSVPHDHILFLSKYVHRAPERFYSADSFHSFLKWLVERDRADQIKLRQYIVDEEAELDRAFLHLQEINASGEHDHRERLDDYELIQFVDRQVHPRYLRLVEAVYAPFVRIVAYFSRLDHGKGTEGLDLWQAVQELSKTTLSGSTGSYNHLVRNGIAHGGITYLQREIRYRDKKGNEEQHSVTNIIRLCDDLLDVCNGLALALSLFLVSRQLCQYPVPRQVLLDELREEARAPWWQIVGCVPSELIDNRKQLLIYVRVRTFDFLKVLFSAIQSGVLAERFAPGFDRYFFSLHSTTGWPGWAMFDGDKLRELRGIEGATLHDYSGAIVENGIFYIPKIKLPRLLHRLQNMALSFKLHWPIAMEDVRERLGVPKIHVRNAQIHRNGWGLVVQGEVVIAPPGKEVDQEVVRKFRRRIIRSVLREARRNTPCYSTTRYLPMGYARIAVFRKDYRRRRLDGFGLGCDLVGTIQVKLIQRIKAPDILGAKIEQVGGYRLAWNRAWIEHVKSNDEARPEHG